MELKSLSKLRDFKKGFYRSEQLITSVQDYCKILADEIQAEVDKYYLPRPLFDDGEPVQWGDIAIVNDELGEVIEITYRKEGFSGLVIGFEGGYSHEDHFVTIDGPRIKRPPVPDTQERIDEDASLPTEEYCKKYGLSYVTREDCIWSKWEDLFKRQRKLCMKERDA